MRSSSPDRFPFVFSSSSPSRSMVCRARARFVCGASPSGGGASPRCTSAEWLSDRTNVAKSSFGSASSSGFCTGGTRDTATCASALAAAEGGLRDGDRLGLLAQVGQLRRVPLEVLLGQGAVLDVSLADPDVPVPAVDRLRAHGGSFSKPRFRSTQAVTWISFEGPS